MGLGFGEALILLLIILIIFGAGRLPKFMGDLGQGIRAFKDGMTFAATRTEDVQTTGTAEILPAIPYSPEASTPASEKSSDAHEKSER